jgi:pimeloyl-ACP methyl ester carboxylesterase
MQLGDTKKTWFDMEELLLRNKIALRKNRFKFGRDTLIFIHGLAGSSSAWSDYVQWFAEEFNIILLDLRGHGKSCRYEKFSDYYISSFSEDIDAIFSDLNIQQASLISHSFGCFIAMDYIAKHPEKINKAIFISAGFNTRNRVFYSVLSIINSILGPVFKFMKTQNPGRRLNYKDFPGNTDFNPRRIYHDVMNTGLQTFIYCILHTLRYDGDEKIKNIVCPSLFIHGDKDTVFPLKHAFFNCLDFSNSWLTIAPNANHVVVLTHAEFLSRKICSFVSMDA